MNKYFLIILISISLIVYTNSATCNTLTTDTTCKADSGCSWTAATCTGNTACTSHTSTQSDCQNTKYGAVTCTWDAGNSACNGGTPCTGKTGADACTAASVEGTACTYTAGSCSEKGKEGDDSKDDKEGSDDDGSSSDSSFGLKSTILLFLAFLLF